MQPAAGEEAALHAPDQRPETDAQHREPDRDHDPERPEHDAHGGLILARDGVEPVERRVQIVLEDQRGQLGDADRVIEPLVFLIGDAEEVERRALGVALEMPLHRHDLGGLMLERVDAVQVAGEDLQRGDQHRHPHRHREIAPRGRIAAVAQQVQRAHRAHDEGRRQEGRQHHVHEAVGEGRVEHDRPPVLGDELPHVVDREALRRLHPAVDRQDPEGRAERAQRDDRGRGHVQPLAHLLAPEEHDPEEPGLEEEGRQHLIGHQRADHRPGLVGKHRPVGAELVGHHDARHHAHAEGDGKDLLPVLEQRQIGAVAGPQPLRVEHGEIACQTDGEGRKDDVKRDGKGELYARQHLGGERVEHERFPL